MVLSAVNQESSVVTFGKGDEIEWPDQRRLAMMLVRITRHKSAHMLQERGNKFREALSSTLTRLD